jgi:hypothetical protein
MPLEIDSDTVNSVPEAKTSLVVKFASTYSLLPRLVSMRHPIIFQLIAYLLIDLFGFSIWWVIVRCLMYCDDTIQWHFDLNQISRGIPCWSQMSLLTRQN